MKVLIIEDEKPAAKKLVRLLLQLDASIQVLETIESVEEATNWLISNPYPDLIFMDVQLDDGLCFEIFENIDLKVPVIFTTAFDEYSLQAFKVHSIDYLLKPVSLEELAKALDKYRYMSGLMMDNMKVESLVSRLNPARKERFLIKVGEHFRSFQAPSIQCFYIRERNNFIIVDTGRTYAIDHSLDKIEKMVDPSQFFRVNRNFILNYSAINDIVAWSTNRLKIILNGWTETDDIIVSRERVAEFKAWMGR